jgi:hypothetical protein
MGGRVVEGTGLENRQARERLVGSNPTPSAKPPDLLENYLPYWFNTGTIVPENRAIQRHLDT